MFQQSQSQGTAEPWLFLNIVTKFLSSEGDSWGLLLDLVKVVTLN